MKSTALVILVGFLALWAEPTSASHEQRPELIMRKAGLDESQTRIKIAGRNINNLRYADDTTLMAEIIRRTCPSFYLDNCIKDGNFCSTDNRCPGKEICCKSNCGQECQLPMGDHPGYCPKLSRLPRQVKNCKSTCQSDQDCGTQYLPTAKCCSNGCAKTCQVAEEEHPGKCPLKELRASDSCKDKCQDDRDCPLTQKCCFNGCGLECMGPVRDNKCYLPLDVGRCDGSEPRYYYDASQEKCVQFTFRFCGGNSNNFKTKDACEAACGKIRPEICKVEMKDEPCDGHPQVYYYNSTAGQCEIFPYEHCGGERFRFRTKLECMMVCGNSGNTPKEN